jgi:hypothetical protein
MTNILYSTEHDGSQQQRYVDEFSWHLEEERRTARRKANRVGKSRSLETARDMRAAPCEGKPGAETKHQQPNANDCKRPNTAAEPTVSEKNNIDIAPLTLSPK